MLKKLITTIILILTFLTFNICVYAEPPLNDPSCNYFMPERSTIGAPRINNPLAGEFNVQNNAQPANINQEDNVEAIEPKEKYDAVKRYYFYYNAFNE